MAQTKYKYTVEVEVSTKRTQLVQHLFNEAIKQVLIAEQDKSKPEQKQLFIRSEIREV